MHLLKPIQIAAVEHVSFHYLNPDSQKLFTFAVYSRFLGKLCMWEKKMTFAFFSQSDDKMIPDLLK